MAREIKFRAKALDGPWEYGELHIKNCRIPHIHTDARATIYIEPNTVGQFTGLHDKNGKEIYEGDIVRFRLRFRLIGEAEYQDGTIIYEGGRFYSKLTNSEIYLFGKPDDYEVIGNIYDNPELLKED